MVIFKYQSCVIYLTNNYYSADNDFSIVTSDILLLSYAGIEVSVTLSVDSLAGEPNETFVISSQAPIVPSPNDASFLFRNTTFLIIDADSK